MTLYIAARRQDIRSTYADGTRELAANDIFAGWLMAPDDLAARLESGAIRVYVAAPPNPNELRAMLCGPPELGRRGGRAGG